MKTMFTVTAETDSDGGLRVRLIDASGEVRAQRTKTFRDGDEPSEYAWLQEQFTSAVGSAVVMGLGDEL